MKKRKKKPINPLWLLPSDERHKGFNRDKDRLLKECGFLPAREYQDRIDALIEKWHI